MRKRDGENGARGITVNQKGNPWLPLAQSQMRCKGHNVAQIENLLGMAHTPGLTRPRDYPSGARYGILSRLSSVGNTDLALLRSWRMLEF